MKTKLFFSLVLVLSLFLVVDNTLAQGANFVANAKLTISFKGRTAICTTNQDGQFAISLSDTSQTFKNINEQIASVDVSLPKTFNKKVTTTKLYIKLKKEKAPYYEFVLGYKIRNANNQDVELVIEEINSIKASGKNKPIRRTKGDPKKIGDKYMGQVAHF